ncbi:MAG: glycosyl hydrolase family 8 [Pseudomonadota bacterium]
MPATLERAHGSTHHGVQALQTSLTKAEWDAFSSRFISPDGRVVDIERGGVSHSEGQAYGMLLAVAADDKEAFSRIYSFTWNHMRGRSDSLISWIYNPKQYPRITDTNNATDGDIIFAYSLVLGALKWDEPRFLHAAQPIIDQIGDDLLVRRAGYKIVRPAAFGFDSGHADGPVINLSYYIYGAFLLFYDVTGEQRWMDVWRSGLELTEAAVSISRGFAPDWATLRSDRWLNPANGFAHKSSYDAVRIPLYMALNGKVPAGAFAQFHRTWNERGRGAPKDFHLEHRATLADMNDPGYRAIAAIAACAAAGTPLPRDLQRVRPTTYFATALHLMSLVAVRTNYPWCADPIDVPDTVLIASAQAQSVPAEAPMSADGARMAALDGIAAANDQRPTWSHTGELHTAGNASSGFGTRAVPDRLESFAPEKPPAFQKGGHFARADCGAKCPSVWNFSLADTLLSVFGLD